MYVLRYKTCRRHVPQVVKFTSYVFVAEWLQRNQGDILECCLYADGPLDGTHIESCRLAVYKACTTDANGRLRFHRQSEDEQAIPLVIAWNRRNHPGR